MEFFGIVFTGAMLVFLLILAFGITLLLAWMMRYVLEFWISCAKKRPAQVPYLLCLAIMVVAGWFYEPIGGLVLGAAIVTWFLSLITKDWRKA